MPRETHSDFRHNNFDLIRIFAAIQVLFFHAFDRLSVAAPFWMQPLKFFYGVPIFFVASGYLVSASYERQNGDLRKYFRNRFLRIYPGLWVCIWVTVLVVLFFGFRFTRISSFLWGPMQMTGVIYTPHFLDSFGSGTYNGALWTIPLELQFYVVLTAVYFLMRRSRHQNRALWAVFAFFVVLSLALFHFSLLAVNPSLKESHVQKLFRYSFAPQFYLFLTGVLLQRYKAFQSKWISGKGLYWIVFYSAFTYLFTYLKLMSPALDMLGLIILGVAAISTAYTAPRFGESLLKGQDISYGVYIYHGLVINILVELKMTGSWLDMGILIPCALLLALLSWRLVEMPFLRRKQARIPVMQEPAI